MLVKYKRDIDGCSPSLSILMKFRMEIPKPLTSSMTGKNIFVSGPKVLLLLILKSSKVNQDFNL